MTDITKALDAIKDNLPTSRVDAQSSFTTCAKRWRIGSAAKLAQLEADNAALMEVVRAMERIHTASGEAFVRKEAREALTALPAHLKEEASK